MAVITKKENIEQIMGLVTDIIGDQSIPKNIKLIAEQVESILNDSVLDFDVKKDKSIQLLDNVCEDANMNMFTRTQIWNIISMLEEE